MRWSSNFSYFLCFACNFPVLFLKIFIISFWVYILGIFDKDQFTINACNCFRVVCFIDLFICFMLASYCFVYCSSVIHFKVRKCNASILIYLFFSNMLLCFTAFCVFCMYLRTVFLFMWEKVSKIFIEVGLNT